MPVVALLWCMVLGFICNARGAPAAATSRYAGGLPELITPLVGLQNPGQFSPFAAPNPRRGTMLWRDTLQTNLIWLFSGYIGSPEVISPPPLFANCINTGVGLGPCDTSPNDLWKYDLSIGQWAFVGGISPMQNSNEPNGRFNCEAKYPTYFLNATINTPSYRYYSYVWSSTQVPGSFYTFGGQMYQCTSSPECPYPNGCGTNDNWSFNSTAGNFTYWGCGPGCGVGGPTQPCPTPGQGLISGGSLPFPGVFSALNRPVVRYNGAHWTRVEDGTHWLFGGYMPNNDGTQPDTFAYILGDVWAFKPSGAGNPFQWKLMWNSSSLETSAVQDTHASSDTIGALYVEGASAPRAGGGQIAVVDSLHSECVWIYGGHSKLSGSSDCRGRLWRFNMTSLKWALYHAGRSSASPQSAVYGTKGMSSGALLATPNQFLLKWIVLPQQPNIAYTFGGGDRPLYTNALWAMILGRDNLPPIYIWVGGGNQVAVTQNNNGPNGDTGYFSTANVPGSVMAPALTLTNIPYTIDMFMGEIRFDPYYVRNVQFSLLSPTWIFVPSSSLTGSPTALSLFVVAVPYEFTSPVNGITANLTLFDATTDLPVNNLLAGQVVVSVVNGWANWTNVRVRQGGLYYFRPSFSGSALHDVKTTNITFTCTTGCLAGQCTSSGLAVPGQCQVCDVGLGYVLNLNATRCNNSCPSDAYIGSPTGRSQCLQCTPGCLACTAAGLTTAVCSKCDEPNGFLLHNGACVRPCPVGSFANFTASPALCEDCVEGCAKCNGTGLSFDVCQQCAEQPYRISADNTGCVKQCGANEYYIPRQCFTCTPGCAQCDGPGLMRPNCTRCDAAAGMAALNNVFCVSDCGTGKFKMPQPDEVRCQNCDIACTNCTGPGPVFPNCTTCSEPTFVISHDARQCAQNCAPGFYKNTTISPMRCVPCDEGCVQCSGPGLSSSTCSICDESADYTRNVLTCSLTCDRGFYNNRVVPNAHFCAPCNDKCTSCMNLTYCDSCNGAKEVGLLEDGVCGPCHAGHNATLDGVCQLVYCEPPDSTKWASTCALTAWSQRCPMTCLPGYSSAVPVNPAGYVCERVGSNGGGYFIDAPSCAPCQQGSYNPTAGGTCIACDNADTATIASTDISQCLCRAEFYPTGPGQCSSCPDGAVCPGNNLPPQSKPGYFQPAQGIFAECLPTAACAGNNKCSPGYEGALCGACSPEYYRLNGFCIPCGNNTTAKIAAGALLGTVACIVLIILARPAPVGRPKFSIATPPIALACIQVTATFGAIKLPWPSSTQSMFDIASALNFNIEIVNTECVVKFSFYDKFQVLLLIPLVIFAIFMLIFLITCAVVWVRAKFKDAARHQIRAVASLFTAGFVLFLNLAYLFLAQATLSFFSCIYHPDGTVTLKESPAQSCYDDQWYKFLPLAIYGILAYVLFIPFFIVATFVRLSRRQGKLMALSNGVINFMVVKYRVSFWFWEFAVLLRKLLIVAISCFVVGDPIIAAVLCSAVLFASCVATISMKPFLWDKHDVAESASIVTSLLVLFAGIVCGTPGVSQAAQDVVGGLAVAVVVIAAIIFTFAFVLEAYIKFNILFRLGQVSDLRGTLTGHVSEITCLEAVGNSVFSSDASGNLRRWDATTLKEEAHASLPASIVSFLVLDGSTLIVGLAGGSLAVCASETLTVVTQLPAASGGLHALSSVQGCVVTGHANGDVHFWRAAKATDLSTLSQVATRKAPDAVSKLLQQNNNELYVVLSNGAIQRWDVNVNLDVEVTARWSLNRDTLEDVALHRDVLYVAAGRIVQAIDTKASAPLCDYPNDAAGVSRVRVVSGRLLTGTWAGVANVWELSGAFHQGTPGKQAHIVALAGTAEHFYSADATGAIACWNIKDVDISRDLDPVRRRWRQYREKHRASRRPLLLSDFLIGDTSALLADATFDRDAAASAQAANQNRSGHVDSMSGGPGAEEEGDMLMETFGSVRLSSVDLTSSHELNVPPPLLHAHHNVDNGSGVSINGGGSGVGLAALPPPPSGFETDHDGFL